MKTSAPIGLVAPWWRDYNKAVADGKVTKAEVKSLIETHKSQFDDKLYGKAIMDLAAGTSKDAKATVWAKKELNAALARPVQPPNLWFPTKEQITKTYAGIVHARMEAGTLKPMDHAPKGIENAARYDITPKGLLGSHSEVYDVGGHLYLAQTPVVPNAKPTWYDVGPAPMF